MPVPPAAGVSPHAPARSVGLWAARPGTPRKVGAIILLAGVLLAILAGSAAGQPTDEPPRVDVVEISGLLDERMVAHLEAAMARAEDEQTTLVALVLDSPAALRVSPRRLVRPFLDSTVPVLAYVGPGLGARATGGAAFLVEAAHLRAAAPGAVIGAAWPADLVRAGDQDTAEALMTELAALRARDPAAAAEAVRERAAVAIVADGAANADVRLPSGVDPATTTVLAASAALQQGRVDVVAGSLSDALLEVSGQRVRLGPPGSFTVTLDLDPTTAQVRFNNPGIVRRLLHAVANPGLAYLLVVAGALCLLFEVFQPGFGVAGVSGLGLAGLGFYGLWALPTRWVAVLVLVAGLALLAADLALARLGALTAAGTVAFAAGSVWLFRGAPVLRLHLWLVALVTVAVVLFFVVVMTVVLRAQGNQALAGAEHLVGRRGVVRSILNPEGHVFVDGALWRARAPDDAGKVRTGTPVRVVGLDDRLTLQVELDSPSAVELESPSPTGS